MIHVCKCAVCDPALQNRFILLFSRRSPPYNSRSELSFTINFSSGDTFRLSTPRSTTSNSSSNSIVGVYKDKIIAYGSIVIENKIRGERAGHIEDIVVDKDARGNNIGIKLIEKLIEIGKKKNCYRTTLLCDKNLIKFYNKTGFTLNGVAMKIIHN